VIGLHENLIFFASNFHREDFERGVQNELALAA
jgi:hypothetical protein